MRRAVWLLVLGFVAAVLGVATARAAVSARPFDVTTTGTTATTTSTSTTSTTTTETTSTTTTATTTDATTTTTTTSETTTSPDSVAKPKHPSNTKSRKHRRRPPPDYPSSPNPFLGGSLSPAAEDNAVVSIAMRYLGVPYKWGGAKPKTGFDCSGLVQYVFAQLGVFLPHDAAAQYHSSDAVWVAPNRLQPGDLVFFIGRDGTREEPGHVGIYVGDGYLIDAPHTGLSVRIDSLDEPWFANEYVGAKRIVGGSLDALLVDMVRPAGSLILRRQMPGPAVGISLSPVAVEATAACTSPPRQYALSMGVGIGGALLLLAGVIGYRRRARAGGRSPDTPN